MVSSSHGGQQHYHGGQDVLRLRPRDWLLPCVGAGVDRSREPGLGRPGLGRTAASEPGQHPQGRRVVDDAAAQLRSTLGRGAPRVRRKSGGSRRLSAPRRSALGGSNPGLPSPGGDWQAGQGRSSVPETEVRQQGSLGTRSRCAAGTGVRPRMRARDVRPCRHGEQGIPAPRRRIPVQCDGAARRARSGKARG